MIGMNERAFTRESSPLGTSWEEWVIRWWRWCSTEPDETNPANDRTGIYCSHDQRYPNVWFLAGTFGGSVKRRCVIPRERSIFFPVVTDRISYAEHNYLKTEDQLSDYARSDLDYTSKCEVSVDGTRLKSEDIRRVHTNLFKFKFAPGVENGMSYAISDGYWVFLTPMHSGNHSLYFIGEKLKYDELYQSGFTGNTSLFRVEVEYSLVVQ
jgi:hypothetical protein